jgi:hypothetical protein
LDFILKRVNGLILPGGSTPFEVKSGGDVLKDFLKFADTGKFLVEKAIEYNKNGTHFPVWGFCLGHELLSYVVSGRGFKLIKRHGQQIIRACSRCFKSNQTDCYGKTKKKLAFQGPY